MKRNFFQSALNIGTPAVLLYVNDTLIVFDYFVGLASKGLIKRPPQ